MSRYVSPQRALILPSLLLAAFAINLDITIVNVALPSLVRELHASTSELQWVVDAYSLVFAALILTAGSLSDRLGRKGFLLAGLAVFGLASVAGGLTASASQLIVARCFMGLGAAMIFPSTLSLISNAFTERTQRARAIGLWGASAGAAIALGPIVGGWLLERFSWQSIFFAMTPVAAVGGALVAFSVPTSRDPRAPRIDVAGLVLSTAAMASLIYTLIEAPSRGWGSAPASVLGTKLAVRFGTKLVVAIGLAFLAIFFTWVSTATLTTTYLTIAITMVICGTGMGLTSAPATEAIMGVVPKDKAGVGSAVNDATRLLGSTLGVAVMGSISASVYASRLASALPVGLPASVTHAARQSVGAALTAATRLGPSGDPAVGGAVHHAAAHAFTHGLSIACLVAAAVSATGAVLAGLLLPAHPPRPRFETAPASTAPRAIAAVD